MKYSEFERILTPARMGKYLTACNLNTKKAMTLYRFNLRLSQELFTVVSCFEVSLRNAIDQNCLSHLGNEWLKNGAATGGIFDSPKCRLTASNVNDAIKKLNSLYTHNKLVAELGFGFWRYMFGPYQYNAIGKTLLQIFPARPTSSPIVQYNQTFVFNELAKINHLRNRIAHHEPICFQPGNPIKDTTYVRQHYRQLKQLFQWMCINEGTLLYGLDHVDDVCNRIDSL